MAFRRNPSNDTYEQEDILLTKEWISRQGDAAGNKDELFLNCFFETVRSRSVEDKRQYIIKRAGSSVYFTPAVSGVIRGLFFWPDVRYVVYVIDNDVYLYQTSTGTTITCSNCLGSSSGPVGMTNFLYDDGSVDLVVTDGTTLINIDYLGTVTTSVSPDLPTPHIPKPVFLDGYLFLVEEASASIWNSDLNDPLLWTAGNFIDAEMEPDRVVSLEKINNYLVAFGSTSVEYFWDAGVETGSPLQRNETPVKINKYISGFSKYGNSLYYIGAVEGGQLDVFRLQDFQLESVGTPTITRYLTSLSDTLTGYSGFIISCLGHTFYLIHAGDYSFVFDIETNKWFRWAYKTQTNFNIAASTQINSTTKIGTIFALGGASTIHIMDDVVYRDNGTNFNVIIVTEPSDFGTLNRKSMHKLSIYADRPAANSNVSIYYTDDDFQTYSSAITVNLNQDLPSITRLGSFRQRAFKLLYSDNYPFRLQKFQVNINKGRN